MDGSTLDVTYVDGPFLQHATSAQPYACAYFAKRIWSLDPPLSTIGIGNDLRNWMPDTGTSSRFTPCGYIVKCTARGIVEVNMITDDGHPLKALLHEVVVPGIRRHLFSVTAFATRGHYAIVKKSEIHLIFGKKERPHLDAQEWHAYWQECNNKAYFHCA